ncbi:MAG: tetratricopeptide repeat protein [Myxococcota bacterium]
MAIVVDLLDAIAVGSEGIHLVVTDRFRAVRAEIEARCPAGWVVAALLASERDRLSPEAYEELGDQGLVLLGVVEPLEDGDRVALLALNTDREWLLRPGRCAVVLVVGEDAAVAESAYLELQGQAPDLWSVRTRVHRVVGPDPEGPAQDQLVDLLSPRFRGDRRAAARWLDTRPVWKEWVAYRLWRNGTSREAWLSLSTPAIVDTSRASYDLQFESLLESSNSSKPRRFPGPPVGEAIEINRWPRPAWPSGYLDLEQNALISALGAMLDRQGSAILHRLPKEEVSDRLDETVRTLGLLRESRYARVLHLDARESLEVAIRQYLRDAGEIVVVPGLVHSAQRLSGAIGEEYVLLLLTNVTHTELEFLRAVLPGREFIASLRSAPQSTFCVLGPRSLWADVKWAAAQLSQWSNGAWPAIIEPETAILDLRTALARAEHIILLADSSLARLSSKAWHPLTLARSRTTGLLLGDPPFPTSSSVEWKGFLDLSDATAHERLLAVAREVAGEPVVPEELHPRTDRLALLVINEKVFCSGYLVDPRHVLTTAHGVGPVGSRVEIRIGQEAERRSAIVAWRGDGVADVALVTLSEVVRGRRGRDPLWADGRECELLCDVIGYRLDGGAGNDLATEVVRGVLEPDVGTSSSRLHARFVSGELPNMGWEGIAGAGLFVEGLLVGVVTHAYANRLLGWPVAQLADRSEFQAALGRSPAVLVDRLWPLADQPLLRALVAWNRPTLDSNRPVLMLKPRYEIVEFEERGREEALSLLQDFADDPREAGVQVIVGPAGVGKTRLMLEWCRRMRDRGWLAGFLSRGLGRRGSDELMPLVRGKSRRFVVVDYSETVPELTTSLLEAMFSRPLGGPRMRVVLLARGGGPWLERLRDELGGRALPVHALGELYSSEEAQERGFEAARAKFGSGTEPNSGSSDTLRLETASHDDEVAERALYVHMRALLAARGEKATQELTAQQVLERVLGYERSFWQRWLAQCAKIKMTKRLEQGAEQMAAAVVLCGSTEIFAQSVGLFRNAAPELSESELRAVTDCFSELYPRTPVGEGIAPIEPDLLGDTLVATVIERDAKTDGGLERWLALPLGAHAPPGATTRALTVLTRLGQRGIGRKWLTRLLAEHGVQWVREIDEAANSNTIPEPAGLVLAGAIAHVENGAVARAIGDAVPGKTVELREVAATAYSVALRHTRDGEGTTAAEMARLLVLQGMSLSKLGRREEALTLTQEGVEIYRRLAGDRPDAFLADLAKALNALGADLSDLGRREDALVVNQEAVEIYRRLAEERPAGFLPALASAFNNLGLRLGDLGRREEALAFTQEAVEIYRRLAEDHPDAFLPDLALALNNLGAYLTNIGRREDALAVTREAVEIYRGLAEDRPDAFLPDLGSALNNLGIRWGDLGRREDALDVTREAVEIYQGLAEDRPDAFLPDLGSALNNLGIRLSELGRREEALAVIQEAVEIYRRLAQERPDVFLPRLSMVLNNVGVRLGELGRREEAVAATQEAVAAFRGLAEDRPDTFLPDLGSTLNNLGIRLGVLGRREEAVAAIHEAVAVFGGLAEDRPDAFVPDLARSLGVLGTMYSTAGSYTEAFDAFCKGLRTLHPVFARFPDAVRELMGVLSRDARDASEAAGIPVPEDIRPFVESRDGDP